MHITRSLPCALAVILAAGCAEKAVAPWGPAAPEVRAYVDTALNFTESTFYFRSRVNWPAAREMTYARSTGAKVFSGAHPALDTLVRELNDRHSYFLVPSRTVGTSNPPPEVAFHRPFAKAHAPRIAYLWLPMFTGTNTHGRADTTSKAVALADSTPNLCGWIIDLRGNLGGYWPAMLAGISGLLPEGNVGGFVERDTTQRYLYEVHRGSAGLRLPDGTYYEYLRMPQVYLVRDPSLPVALLQGGWTASAGEILLMAFRDNSRPVRSFGSASYGAASQPYTKRLVDTASLQVTAALMFDRERRTFENYTIPVEQAVTGPTMTMAYVPGAATDPVIDAATDWLRGQAACNTAARAPAAVRDGTGVRAGWVTPGAVPGARPASEWPKGKPTMWKAALPTPIP
jgi:carboxyl-terminal processing protease